MNLIQQLRAGAAVHGVAFARAINEAADLLEAKQTGAIELQNKLAAIEQLAKNLHADGNKQAKRIAAQLFERLK